MFVPRMSDFHAQDEFVGDLVEVWFSVRARQDDWKNVEPLPLTCPSQLLAEL